MKPAHGRRWGSALVFQARDRHRDFGSRPEAANVTRVTVRLFTINRSIQTRIAELGVLEKLVDFLAAGTCQGIDQE